MPGTSPALVLEVPILRNHGFQVSRDSRPPYSPPTLSPESSAVTDPVRRKSQTTGWLRECGSGHGRGRSERATSALPFPCRPDTTPSPAAEGLLFPSPVPRLLLFIPASRKVPFLHQHAQVLLTLQSPLNSHFLFKTFSNCSGEK